jgi:hypothetical protein
LPRQIALRLACRVCAHDVAWWILTADPAEAPTPCGISS